MVQACTHGVFQLVFCLVHNLRVYGGIKGGIKRGEWRGRREGLEREMEKVDTIQCSGRTNETLACFSHLACKRVLVVLRRSFDFVCQR